MNVAERPVEGASARALSPDEALAKIAALVNDAGYAGLPSNLVAKIKAVLDRTES